MIFFSCFSCKKVNFKKRVRGNDKLSYLPRHLNVLIPKFEESFITSRCVLNLLTGNPVYSECVSFGQGHVLDCFIKSSILYKTQDKTYAISEKRMPR